MAEAGGAVAINFANESVTERLNELTDGKGPEKCIDATGLEAHVSMSQPDTLLDRAKQMLELGVTDCSDGIREAAVVELDGHHYALIVDLVEDVVEATGEPTAIRAAMGEGWERASKGMVETEQGPLLLVDIGAIVSGAERQAA